MTIDNRKINIIEKITRLSDNHLLESIEQLLALKTDNSALIQRYVKPIRKVTNLEKMIAEKQYKGINKAVIQSITKTINIPQSTDDLLKMLD
jgi:hypothetical protein